MPKRTSKNRPTKKMDVNQIAAHVVEITSGQPMRQIKNEAAVALGRLGGLRGGKARAEKLDSERRRQIASAAARARWDKEKGT